MMVPDYALIGEIMLYAEGFLDSRVLAQKMVQPTRHERNTADNEWMRSPTMCSGG